MHPPKWTEQQLDGQRLIAIEEFRKQRLEEPLEQYATTFDEYQGVVEEFLELTVDLSDLDAQVANILKSPRHFETLRYLAGPPISLDDLKVVTDTNLPKQQLLEDPVAIARIRQVIRDGLDRRRFPWVFEEREPTEIERQSAIVASSALIAMRRVETVRRNYGRKAQELAVRTALTHCGFKEVKRRKVKVLADAPGPGEFCAESKVGKRKADVLVGLWDRRLLAIECKVSNSSTNSVKRLNNDAAAKAVSWIQDFGTAGVVPAAVLGGVYKLHNLVEAQDRGLTLFWDHDLASLTSWIASTR